MKITKTQLRKMIKEELTQIKEGATHEGFMEIIMDFLKEELSTWHKEAWVQLRSDLETQPLDLKQPVLDLLDEAALDGNLKDENYNVTT